MALQLTSLNLSGLMWENLSSDLLIMDINKENVCHTATGSDHLYPKKKVNRNNSKKNWRPITLLNSTYKLVSNCIAERIKSVLSHLVSTDQTGFIPGDTLGIIVV
jgi:hypothetical protein